MPQHFENANQFLSKGQLEEAIEEYKKAIKKDPQNGDIYIALARAELMRQEVQLKIDSEQPDSDFYKIIKEAKSLVEKGLRLKPQNPLGLSVSGLIYLLQDQHQEALPFFKEALEKDASSDMARFNLALCEEALGRSLNAQKQLEALLLRSPKHFQAHYELGKILLERANGHQQIIQARDSFLQCLEIRPGFLPAILTLSELYTMAGKEGNIEKAEQICYAGLLHVPEMFGIPLRENLMVFAIKRGDTEKALHHSDWILSLRGHPDDFMSHGNLQVAQGDLSKAEEAYQMVAKLLPQAWEPHYALGELYLKGNASEEGASSTDLARKAYEKAIDLNSEAYAPQNALGLLFLGKNDEAGKVPQAIASFEKALVLKQDAVEPLFNLSLCHTKTKNWGEARKNVEKVLDKTSSDAPLHKQALSLLSAIQEEQSKSLGDSMLRG